MSAKSGYNHERTAASIHTADQKLKVSVMLFILTEYFEFYYQVSYLTSIRFPGFDDCLNLSGTVKPLERI